MRVITGFRILKTYTIINDYERTLEETLQQEITFMPVPGVVYCKELTKEIQKGPVWVDVPVVEKCV